MVLVPMDDTGPTVEMVEVACRSADGTNLILTGTQVSRIGTCLHREDFLDNTRKVVHVRFQ